MAIASTAWSFSAATAYWMAVTASRAAVADSNTAIRPSPRLRLNTEPWTVATARISWS